MLPDIFVATCSFQAPNLCLSPVGFLRRMQMMCRLSDAALTNRAVVVVAEGCTADAVLMVPQVLCSFFHHFDVDLAA